MAEKELVMGTFYAFLLVVACAPVALFAYRRKVNVSALVVIFTLLGGMMGGCGASSQVEIASTVDVLEEYVKDSDDNEDGDNEIDEDIETVIDMQTGTRVVVLPAETTFSVPSREDAERIGAQMGCRDVRPSVARDRDQYVCVR